MGLLSSTPDEQQPTAPLKWSDIDCKDKRDGFVPTQATNSASSQSRRPQVVKTN